MEDLTPMMKQYHEVKQRFPGKLVFFRLGDFYEMFYEDAVLASRELEITLTSRNKDRNGAPIPMCGVPHHSVEGYIARLMKKGFKVAICEQVEASSTNKKLVRREVTRVLTPGTVLEEMLLEPKDNNYLGCFYGTEKGIGMAFMDLTTSDFLATEFMGEQAWQKSLDEFARFTPKEILLPDGSHKDIQAKLFREWSDRWVASPLEDWVFNQEYAHRILLEHFNLPSLDGLGASGHSLSLCAAGALIHYLKETRLTQIGKVANLRFFEPSDFMKLDASTVTNLELTQTLDGSKKGSLFFLLDDTQTGMGARLLKSWLLRPLLNVDALVCRQDSIAAFMSDIQNLDKFRKKLCEIHDLERLVNRVMAEVSNPREILALRDSLRVVPAVRRILQSYSAQRLAEIRDTLDPLEDVVELIEKCISDNAPVSANEPGIVRSGYSDELDEFRDIRHSGKGYIASLESREREKTGIQSLKIKFNNVFGYFIEVTKANLSLVPNNYIRKQTLVNCERFVTEELQEYEEKVLRAEERIASLEKEIFIEFRKRVGLQGDRIQKTARLLGELDVYASLSETALKNDYKRPVLTEEDAIYIRQGRHPVIETQSLPFIPNDLYVNSGTDRLILLTGPNMGGKSTFLRQTALIVILAQMGSFVPAQEARIGCVDRIYTRVGASDNLARGRSTFMVEMIETANILNTATDRSLILLDEVGRGTATFDGLSLAWAIAEYLVNNQSLKPKTLFATHYHELTKMASIHPGVKNYCMTIQEAGGEIIFLRRVTPGVADKSYGIEVARLAGMPRPVLLRAAEILQRLERKDIDLTGRSRKRTADEVLDEIQKPLF
ncbi:MAG: DNA mismatch repair protein MutS [Acidobacteria bacterium]|nr:DNA mismatch repair protein MutS [Acidobacteriota bacterium]